jgi:hypothetical protein
MIIVSSLQQVMQACLRKLIGYRTQEHLNIWVNDEQKLGNVKVLDEPIKIKIAKNNQMLFANKMGDINAMTTLNVTKYIKIKDVLLVPNLTYNLLSIRKLEINSLKTVFENGKSTICKGSDIIAIAFRKKQTV